MIATISKSLLLFLFFGQVTLNAQTTLGNETKPTLNSVKTVDILSIESSLFNVEMLDNEVNLSWSTRTENDNDFFTIERSQDGVNFEEIENINGAGNSASLINYSTIDISPFFGVSYYRLKQTDINGNSKYVETKSINNSEPEIPNSTCYPNPFNNSVSIESEQLDVNEILILDSFGKNITSSVNITINSDFKNSLDFNELPSGVYFIKCGVDTFKVLKL